MATTLTLLSVLAALQTAHGDDPAPAEPPPLSDDAKAALQRLTVPGGFEASLVASEPALLNPVAFAIDRLGRFFVVESFRVNNGVTDMRQHMDWLEEDLAIQTVADRVEMYRRHTPAEDFERLWATGEARVTRLVDRDGDGMLEESTVFADGFRDPADGVAAGVLARVRGDGGTELLFTCIPSLYRLIDGDGDGAAESKETVSTGYGLRVALLGHDLHGLVVGPDQRLYFSIGDRGFNVTTAEGRRLVRLGTGAVLRSELDGSNLEIFCDGLRNPQELAFDDHGNLFTLDNNSDAGDRARWTLLLEGSDTGWRQAYQWIEQPHPRGPWDEEGLWKPHFEGQPSWILPPIANVTDGPSGLVAYPGTGFGPEYDGSFFVCDFRGAAGYSGIWNLRNEPFGSGFRLASADKFIWNALPTDVDFGPDGALYWTDWVHGWGMPGKGRVFRVAPADPTSASRAAADETARWLADGPESRDVLELGAALAHRDRRVRQMAARELMERELRSGDEDAGVTSLLSRLAHPGLAPRLNGEIRPDLAHLHALWTAGAIARRDPSAAAWAAGLCVNCLMGAGDHDDVVALEVLADALDAGAVDLELGPLRAPSLRSDRMRRALVDFHGGRRDAKAMTDFVVPQLRLAVASGDVWLRHSCIRAIERTNDEHAIDELMASRDPRARAAGVVVLRRLGEARTHRLSKALEDPSPLVRAEAAAAIHDARIIGAMEPLSAMLERDLSADTNLTVRRALHASREVATPAAAKRLVTFALDARRGARHRAEALEVLATWDQPLTRDGIVRDHRPIPAAPSLDGMDLDLLTSRGVALSIEDDAVARPLLKILQGRGATGAMVALAESRSLGQSVRARALEAALATKDPRAASLVARILDGADESLLPLRAVAVGTLGAGEAAEQLLQDVMKGPGPLRREALRVLGQLETPESANALVSAAGLLTPDAPALVEWFEAAEARAGKAPAVAQALATKELQVQMTDRDDDAPLGPWAMCLEGGDAALGERIFAAKSETSCTRCHAWKGAGGSEAGPDLSGVGKRLTPEEILRSIVHPNADLAEGYETWLFGLEDGEVISGRILSETAELVTVETAEKEVWDLDADEITARRRDVSAMPGDLTNHLSRREMRDLVAFLRSL